MSGGISGEPATGVSGWRSPGEGRRRFAKSKTRSEVIRVDAIRRKDHELGLGIGWAGGPMIHTATAPEGPSAYPLATLQAGSG